MDETKRESTPQEWEIDIMERYARLMGNKYLLRETVAALLDAACTLKCEVNEKDNETLQKFGLYVTASESLARAALLLDVTSMMLEDAEARAIEEKHILDDWEFQVMRIEKRGRDFEMIPEGGGTR